MARSGKGKKKSIKEKEKTQATATKVPQQAPADQPQVANVSTVNNGHPEANAQAAVSKQDTLAHPECRHRRPGRRFL